MRARSIATIAAVCCGGSAVLVAALIFLLPLLFPGPDIASRLASIDAAIAGGYLSTARAELLAMRPIPRREKDALRLLKRAYLLCRATGDFRLLSVLSDRALAVRGAGPAVRMVAAYSYLRTGRLSDAEAAARAGLPSGAGDLVRGEIILRRGGAWQGSDALTRELTGLETSRNASDFARAARHVDDRRLALDAALLSLEAGDLSSARSVAASALQDATYDEPAALIAYDSGDFETAITRLARLETLRNPRADVALLLADCYHALGREGQLGEALRAAVRLDPRISWTPYANLGLMAEKGGDIPLARSVLAQGRALFPGSSELVLATADLEAGQGNPAAAIALLDGLVAERPDDADAALLRLSLMAPGMSPQAYRAELWKLFGRLPSDRRVFMTLAPALIGSHDWNGVAAALHQHASAGAAEDDDTLSIRALVESMQGKDAQAVDTMSQAAGSDGSGRYRYDLAVLLLHRGNAQEALAQLSLAEGEAEGKTTAASSRQEAGNGGLLARIETLKGRCLLVTGDVAGARAAFLRARVLDPHELRPGLELRKLEAQGVQ